MKKLPWKSVFLAALLALAPLACSLGELPPEVSNPTPTRVPPLDSTPVGLPSPTAEPGPPASDLVQARVTRVVDGDTIQVLLGGVEYRVRYIGIDTPETKHPTRGVEPFGPEASEANRALVEGKTVFLEKDVSEVDQYGRLLRYVYVGDLMVNEELLRQGLARVATFPPDVKYVDHFLAVQRGARDAGLGIWGDDAFPAQPTVPPG